MTQTPQEMAEAFLNKEIPREASSFLINSTDRNLSRPEAIIEAYTIGARLMYNKFIAGFNAATSQQGLRWRTVDKDNLPKWDNISVLREIGSMVTINDIDSADEEGIEYKHNGISYTLAYDKLEYLDESVCSKTELTEISTLTAERDRYKALTQAADRYFFVKDTKNQIEIAAALGAYQQLKIQP